MLARRIRFRHGTCLNSGYSDLTIFRGPSGLFSCIQISGSTVTQIRGNTSGLFSCIQVSGSTVTPIQIRGNTQLEISRGRNGGYGGGFGAHDGVELVDLGPLF